MRNALLAFPLCLALAACDGGSGPTGGNSGPVRLGLANSRQTAESGVRFGAPVVAKAVRIQTASGWKIQLVTPLYADTGMIGAPAAGVRACWNLDAQVNQGGPQPDALCKTTDAGGLASFVFAGGTRAGRYVHRPCTYEGDTCVNAADSAVLTVVPRSPVATKLRVGLVETRGTGVGDTLAFADPDLFTDGGGQLAAYRVDGTNWLEAVSPEVGNRNARLLHLTRTDMPIGDTATVRFYSSTKMIAEARAEVVAYAGTPPASPRTAFVRLTYTMVSVP